MKTLVKKYFIAKLKIAGLIFAIFGWLILFILLFGRFFVKQLQTLEVILQSNVFIWTLRIIIISVIILLIKGKKYLEPITTHSKFKLTLKIIYIGGGLGWLLWILSLLAI